MDCVFVGRERYLKELRGAFQKYPVISVCGLKTVGKSRLVTEFFKLYTGNHGNNSTCTLHVDMHHHDDKDSLYSYLCSNLEVRLESDATKSEDWINHIVRTIQSRADNKYIVIFDNAEDAVEEKIHDGFLKLINRMVKHCRNIRILVTSTTNMFLSSMGRAHYIIELSPLLDFESRELLVHLTEGVEIRDTEMDAIVDLSDGLPLLLLMIGSELTDKDRAVSPKQMVQMLGEFRLEATSRDCYPQERRAAEVYTKFIKRLSEIHLSRVAILNYIPGTFNIREAREMLDRSSDAVAKLDTLQPMIRRHVVYDSIKTRFDIHGILRECIDTFPKMKNLPEIQTRYYRLFSEVMSEVCHKFGTAEYTKALAEFSLEQPNFTKLLREVDNSTGDNYRFFIQVAKKCTSLLEIYMTGLSEQFYHGCMILAERHGEDRDKAAIHVALGSLSTNGKGSFVSGEENYRLALDLLERKGRSIELTSLYQRMGWNLHNQGRNFEALRYLEKALEISSFGGTEYKDIMIQTLNNLGTVHNWIGNCEAAKKYTLKVMEERKSSQGEVSPNYAICLNQMGLISDQLGQRDEAMDYFAKSLDVKRKCNSTVHVLTISLNNVANKYREMKQFQAARDLLDEAMIKIGSQEQKNQSGLSLTYNSYGKLYRDLGDFAKAEENYKKSEEIRQTIMPRSIPYVWTALQLVQIKVHRKKYASGLKVINNILKDKEFVLETMPHNDFVVEALKIKAEIYKQNGDMEAYKDVLNEIHLEIARLLNIFLAKEYDQKYALFRQEWDRIKSLLESIAE